MALVARVLKNCQSALGWRDEAAVFGAFDQGLVTLEQAQDFAEGIKECDPIARDVLQDYPDAERASMGTELAFRWLARSAEAGNRAARLEMLVDVPGQSAEMASLLDELIHTNDPIVFSRAAEFESVRSSLEDHHLHERWGYLGCLHHPGCESGIFRAYIEGTYTPSEQRDIFEFVQSFEDFTGNAPSFQQMLAEKPYTAYSEVEIEYMQRLEEITRTTGKVGIEALRALLQE
jgi:hypothetical protein